MGSTKFKPPADLYAGWAFVLNALGQHGDSNTQAEKAFSESPTWQFPFGLGLDAVDLHLLKAEKYFLLGDFRRCVAEVTLLNPRFDTDVTTSEGLSALASEIERLGGLGS